jgi:hypothetical protein
MNGLLLKGYRIWEEIAIWQVVMAFLKPMKKTS